MMWTNRIANELSSGLLRTMVDVPSALVRPTRSRLDCLSVPILPLSPLGKGDRVRISRGAFCGVEGTVVARRGADRLVVAVALLEHGVTIEIDVSMVQSLEGPRRMRFGR
jgi:hypothetical protein